MEIAAIGRGVVIAAVLASLDAHPMLWFPVIGVVLIFWWWLTGVLFGVFSRPKRLEYKPQLPPWTIEANEPAPVHVAAYRPNKKAHTRDAKVVRMSTSVLPQGRTK